MSFAHVGSRPVQLAFAALVVVTTALALAAPSAAAPPSASALDGVWVCERRFGPATTDAPVSLERSGAGWAAVVGTARVADSSGTVGTLRYRFADGSELRVRDPQDAAIAQWIQPRVQGYDARYATPVRLSATAGGALRGTIRPLAEVEHLFLVVRTAGGVTQAFIRNPEHNAGAFVGTRMVLLQRSTLRLVRPHKPDVTGRYDPVRRSLAMRLPGMAGDFVFVRESASNASAFYARPHVTTYAYRVPNAGADGWQTASLTDVGLNPGAIAAVMNDILRGGPPSLRAPAIQSVQIARHGKLVLDEYFYGFGADRPHDVRSAGKSITALLVGRAIEDGAAIAPRTPVYPLFPEYAPVANPDPRKAAITVEHLLTMSAGYACDDNGDDWAGEDAMQSQTAQPDWYKWTLDLPMAFAPGTKAYYCSPEINLLGAIVQKTTRAWLPDYFAARFAVPMQFGRYAMWLTEPPTDTAYMAGGDYFRPRDFLKFGQLFLDHGRWNGTPVIDPAWLDACATPRTAIEGEIGRYGYAWHVFDFAAGGRTYHAINAGGNGGQLLTVVPELDLAIMITAGNYGQYPVWSQFIERTIPALAAAASAR
jgi:CubicO group peptidase (beta-lactamase class C family)